MLCPNREVPTFHFKEDPNVAEVFALDMSYVLLSVSWTHPVESKNLSSVISFLYDLNINGQIHCDVHSNNAKV